MRYLFLGRRAASVFNWGPRCYSVLFVLATVQHALSISKNHVLSIVKRTTPFPEPLPCSYCPEVLTTGTESMLPDRYESGFCLINAAVHMYTWPHKYYLSSCLYQAKVSLTIGMVC